MSKSYMHRAMKFFSEFQLPILAVMLGMVQHGSNERPYAVFPNFFGKRHGPSVKGIEERNTLSGKFRRARMV